MSIPGAPGPVPPTPGQTPGSSPANTPGADSANPAAKAGDAQGVAFGAHMQPAAQPNAAQQTQAANDTQRVGKVGNIDPLEQAKGIREEITSIRQNLEQMQATGKIDPADGQLQMWRMLDLQTRVQDVHFRVELVTKVVEHGTSSIKQISQTQA